MIFHPLKIDLIELYTSPTPNGHKISIALEEMELDYEVKAIDLMNNEQKTKEYLKICPNGRIPAIVDTNRNNFSVFESGAILLYLAEMSGKFCPNEPFKRNEVIQWLMFQMGGVGPMQGQANVFFRYFPKKIQAVIDRYQNETKRLYKVLDTQLKGKDFICNRLSIADFATFPWVNIHEWSGVEIDDLKHLSAWVERCRERKGFQAGLEVPIKLEILSEEDQREAEKAAQKLLQK